MHGGNQDYVINDPKNLKNSTSFYSNFLRAKNELNIDKLPELNDVQSYIAHLFGVSALSPLTNLPVPSTLSGNPPLSETDKNISISSSFSLNFLEEQLKSDAFAYLKSMLTQDSYEYQAPDPNSLLDLLGYSHIDLISKILDNWKYLRGSLKAREQLSKIPILSDTVPSNNQGTTFGGSVGPTVSVKVLRSSMDPSEKNSSNYNSTKNYQSKISGSSDYPHIYAPQREKSSFTNVLGIQKVILPGNTIHDNNGLYECFTIPYDASDTPEKYNIVQLEIKDAFPSVYQRVFEDYSSRGSYFLNAMQSAVYGTAYLSNENMLVCAPTGAGKTDVAIMVILKALTDHGWLTENFQISNLQKSNETTKATFKIVYIAPLKALAFEITEKFQRRLSCLGIHVQEWTGDTKLSKAQLATTHILVMTPEKLDVCSRGEQARFLHDSLACVIVDEVHLLHEERGSVLESVLSRLFRISELTTRAIRVVGLSATLPNYLDVAAFLRVNPYKGLFFFEGAFRPVPLTAHLIGLKKKVSINISEESTDLSHLGNPPKSLLSAKHIDKKDSAVLLDQHQERKKDAKHIPMHKSLLLDQKSNRPSQKGVQDNIVVLSDRMLLDLVSNDRILSYLKNGNHQVLVFVHSRKETKRSAELFLEYLQEQGCSNLLGIQRTDNVSVEPSTMPSHSSTKNNAFNASSHLLEPDLSNLPKIKNKGIASPVDCHHAGLVKTQRHRVESSFLSGHTRVLFTTATLAWGINLPAHAVIIKGTILQYKGIGGNSSNLGVLDILQIFGRAGRPPFDSYGEATLITSIESLPSYVRALAMPNIPIESRLCSVNDDIRRLSTELFLSPLPPKTSVLASNSIAIDSSPLKTSVHFPANKSTSGLLARDLASNSIQENKNAESAFKIDFPFLFSIPESSLYGSKLLDHFNADIGLGLTSCLADGLSWFRYTFYFVRLCKKLSDAKERQNHLQLLLLESFKILTQLQMIKRITLFDLSNSVEVAKNFNAYFSKSLEFSSDSQDFKVPLQSQQINLLGEFYNPTGIGLVASRYYLSHITVSRWLSFFTRMSSYNWQRSQIGISNLSEERNLYLSSLHGNPYRMIFTYLAYAVEFSDMFFEVSNKEDTEEIQSVYRLLAFGEQASIISSEQEMFSSHPKHYSNSQKKKQFLPKWKQFKPGQENKNNLDSNVSSWVNRWMPPFVPIPPNETENTISQAVIILQVALFSSLFSNYCNRYRQKMQSGSFQTLLGKVPIVKENLDRVLGALISFLEMVASESGLKFSSKSDMLEYSGDSSFSPIITKCLLSLDVLIAAYTIQAWSEVGYAAVEKAPWLVESKVSIKNENLKSSQLTSKVHLQNSHLEDQVELEIFKSELYPQHELSEEELNMDAFVQMTESSNILTFESESNDSVIPDSTSQMPYLRKECFMQVFSAAIDKSNSVVSFLLCIRRSSVQGKISHLAKRSMVSSSSKKQINLSLSGLSTDSAVPLPISTSSLHRDSSYHFLMVLLDSQQNILLFDRLEITLQDSLITQSGESHKLRQQIPPQSKHSQTQYEKMDSIKRQNIFLSNYQVLYVKVPSNATHFAFIDRQSGCILTLQELEFSSDLISPIRGLYSSIENAPKLKKIDNIDEKAKDSKLVRSSDLEPWNKNWTELMSVPLAIPLSLPKLYYSYMDYTEYLSLESSSILSRFFVTIYHVIRFDYSNDLLIFSNPLPIKNCKKHQFINFLDRIENFQYRDDSGTENLEESSLPSTLTGSHISSSVISTRGYLILQMLYFAFQNISRSDNIILETLPILLILNSDALLSFWSSWIRRRFSSLLIDPNLLVIIPIAQLPLFMHKSFSWIILLYIDLSKISNQLGCTTSFSNILPSHTRLILFTNNPASNTLFSALSRKPKLVMDLGGLLKLSNIPIHHTSFSYPALSLHESPNLNKMVLDLVVRIFPALSHRFLLISSDSKSHLSLLRTLLLFQQNNDLPSPDTEMMLPQSETTNSKFNTSLSSKLDGPDKEISLLQKQQNLILQENSLFKQIGLHTASFSSVKPKQHGSSIPHFIHSPDEDNLKYFDLFVVFQGLLSLDFLQLFTAEQLSTDSKFNAAIRHTVAPPGSFLLHPERTKVLIDKLLDIIDISLSTSSTGSAISNTSTFAFLFTIDHTSASLQLLDLWKESLRGGIGFLIPLYTNPNHLDNFALFLRIITLRLYYFRWISLLSVIEHDAFSDLYLSAVLDSLYINDRKSSHPSTVTNMNLIQAINYHMDLWNLLSATVIIETHQKDRLSSSFTRYPSPHISIPSQDKSNWDWVLFQHYILQSGDTSNTATQDLYHICLE